MFDEVRFAVVNWKGIARDVGMDAVDIERFAPAFAHPELQEVAELTQKQRGRVFAYQRNTSP